MTEHDISVNDTSKIIDRIVERAQNCSPDDLRCMLHQFESIIRMDEGAVTMSCLREDANHDHDSAIELVKVRTLLKIYVERPDLME